MLGTLSKGVWRCQHNVGSVGASPYGTIATTHATTPSTKGSPVQVFAATLFDVFWVTLIANDIAQLSNQTQACFDLLGGAATEEVLIANMLSGYAGGNIVGMGPKRWDFPLYIPAGTRIAVRVAGVQTAEDHAIAVYLYGGQGNPPFKVAGRVDTLGMGTVPDGTTVTPGASGGAATFTQMIASSAVEYMAFVPSFQPSGDTSLTPIGAINIGVAIGAAAAEESIGDGWIFSKDTNECMTGLGRMPIFQDVPAGTRISMSAANSGANDGAYNGVIHAMR